MSNTAPNAVDDARTVNAGFSGQSAFYYSSYIDSRLLKNDSDAEADAFSITSVDGQDLVDGSVVVTGDNGGIFTIYEDGTVHLDASTDFETVPDGQSVDTSIDYTVTDEHGASSEATYTVTVNGDYMG